jgi:hypothetical protein
MPEALRFRYRLEGVDADWQDPGTRRAVSYTNLGPGEYRFRVMAADQFGQWSAEEASIAVRILPTFTQTPLFYALCALAVAGLLYLLYLLWLRQATLRIATRMAERERIARAARQLPAKRARADMSFQSALGGLPRIRRRAEDRARAADGGQGDGGGARRSAGSAFRRHGDGDLAQGLLLVGRGAAGKPPQRVQPAQLARRARWNRRWPAKATHRPRGHHECVPPRKRHRQVG